MDCFQLERLMIEYGICQREKVLEGWELAIKKTLGVCFSKRPNFGLKLVQLTTYSKY